MKLFTSYFSKIRTMPDSITPISISLWPPRGWTGKQLKQLAPTREILTAYKNDGNWPAYVEKFERDVLGRLRPEEIIQEITKLSEGRDAALICFEKDPAQCHRTLIANWLRSAGYEISEYSA